VTWVFGYGSLIWRPDFVHSGAQRATLPGYERRFCQASHDHRGTPEKPGRVVTLVAIPGSLCQGMAYQLAEPGRESILSALDEREQDGYCRLQAELQLADGQRVAGITWIAAPDNPSWRAGESLETVARLIAERSGPSGSNREYLFRLEEALVSQNMPDVYVSRLCERVRRL
jgi:cation transport regulator ChaC